MQRTRESNLPAALVGFVVTVLGWGTFVSAAPEVYRHPFLQGPVHATPGELLMIPGDGFVEDSIVVYERLSDTTIAPVPPASVPTSSTSSLGLADVVSCTAQRIVVLVPAVVVEGQAYVFWVRDPDGTWSAGMKVNDARPLWITPDLAYETSMPAGLPRLIKVVGRNLQPGPLAVGAKTLVRLSGPETHTLDAATEANPALQHHVARVALPPVLPVGEYAVEVSRDGKSWVAVQGSLNPLRPETLTVLPDPPAAPEVAVAAFGCAPDDGEDDAACVQQAVAAAAAAGGGTVRFGPGRWELTDVPQPTLGAGVSHGIIVPPGVGLAGDGRGTTRVVRTAGWGFIPGGCPHPTVAGQLLPPEIPCVLTVFTLQGLNSVTGLHFDDEFPDDGEFPFVETTCRSACGADDSCFSSCRLYQTRFIQLGKRPWWTGQGEPQQIDDVVIAGNRFTNVRAGVAAGGWPLRHLFIAYNEFEAFKDDLLLAGVSSRRDVKFNVEDSVIAYNDFYPGDYYDPDVLQGVIASQIGAASQLDFSHNTTHPVSTTHDCATRPGGCGWRAAHFWHMNNNHEALLVSQNRASCTGDKVGDGEAIVFDNAANEVAFASARTVVAATRDSVTVLGPWFRPGSEASGDLDYYGEHWVHVADGRGIGQARKIESCCCGAACTDPSESACGATCDDPIVITVSPGWDVVPQAGGSRVAALRSYWQVYVVDNEVDNRLCDNDNSNAPRSGIIHMHGNSADSSLAGNVQHRTDGIRLNAAYSVESYHPESGARFKSTAAFQHFTEVRGNTIDGEQNFFDCDPATCPSICCDASCCPSDPDVCRVDNFCDSAACCAESCCVPPQSWSGIDLWYGQYRVADSPALSFGVSVSRNSVTRADGLRGGAVGVSRGWWPPPTADNPQYASVVVQHNTITDVERRDAAGECLPYSYFGMDGGIGVHLGELQTHNAVLFANTSQAVCYPVYDGATDTVQLLDCPVETTCSEPECIPDQLCQISDTELNVCLQSDGRVFKCPPFQSVHVSSCACGGIGCSGSVDTLVCRPVPGLPLCPVQSACDDRPGCSTVGACAISDTGWQACRQPGGGLFTCAAGETIQQTECACSGSSCADADLQLACVGAPLLLPSGPGAVPPTIEMSRVDGGRIEISWSPSCSSGAANYGIYEGHIGDWASHVPRTCADEDADFSIELTPSAASSYYLVVPNNVDDDGSFGSDSAGVPRPAPALSCRLSTDRSGCE